jgi:3-hydroxyacyl-[acyl-carrier-protein] dehydratase
MRFKQLDKIIEFTPGERLVATRQVLADEDYFRDHFPLFAVMPGVLMLEALFQASCWLIRATENFDHSLLTLHEAKSVKFTDFMQPDQTLVITVECVKTSDNLVTIKASGTKGDTVAVSARLIIRKSNLQANDASLAPLDAFMRDSMKNEYEKLLAKEPVQQP